MDAYHQRVQTRLKELHDAGEHEKADELEKAVHEVDAVVSQ
jgi:hypothetical protein